MITLREIIDYLKLRHRAKQADYYAGLAFGMCFRLVPPSYGMLYGEEAVWREVERQENETSKFIEARDWDVGAETWDSILIKREERVEKKRQEKLLYAEK